MLRPLTINYEIWNLDRESHSGIPSALHAAPPDHRLARTTLPTPPPLNLHAAILSTCPSQPTPPPASNTRHLKTIQH